MKVQPPPTAADFARSAPLKITVVGTGYVGLIAAVCFASFGHRVTGVDSDADRIAMLGRGKIPIFEADLDEAVAANLAAGRLVFSGDVETALASADIVMIAVGTPQGADGGASLVAIDAVAEQVARVVRHPAVVTIKSTVPVGTTRRLQAKLDAAAGSDAARVLMNPEFLREGTALHDFMNPDRVIIGAEDDAVWAAERLLEAYAPLVARDVPVLRMDTRSAELAKTAANAMLATRISFVNELAAIAEATGADIERVCEGMGSDRRIGAFHLRAGLGYGGSCFPKDVAALRHTARQHQLRTDLLMATERVNHRQSRWALSAMQREIGLFKLRGLRAAIWGLAFKPGTDDMRDAPSVPLIAQLLRVGVQVSLHDPVAMDNARALIPAASGLRWAETAEAALADADVLVVVTEWPEYLAFDPARVAAALQLRMVFDGRNRLDTTAWGAAGLHVVQVGRPVTTTPGRAELPEAAIDADAATAEIPALASVWS